MDYLAGGDVPEDLVLSKGTVTEQNRQKFFGAAVAGDNLTEDDFQLLAQKHGFQEAWVAEQARRGFIARKPDAEGITRVSVTSKARTRYSV